MLVDPVVALTAPPKGIGDFASAGEPTSSTRRSDRSAERHWPPKGQAADIHINVDGAISLLALFLDLKLKPAPRRPRQESRHDVIGWSHVCWA